MSKLKRIAITMGDPNGVGPEICIQALESLPVGLRDHYLVFGDELVLKQAAKLLKSECIIKKIKDLNTSIEMGENEIFVFDGGVVFNEKINAGVVSKKAGIASIGWVEKAVESIKKNEISAMVTAPICKESIEQTIPGFQGHTEFIGEMCGDPEPVLALIHKRWVVAHVSTHVSLREACDRVTETRVTKTALLLNELCTRLFPDESIKLGLAGLNPHAGENGLFGIEEQNILNPTAHQLREQGVEITNALPADVVFPMLKGEHFHGVVAMYHDQGHVVTKTLAFDLGEKRELRGVNITLGVEVLRTSVDHGTGFDVAWKGIAASHSLLDAMDVAMKMANNEVA